jgi:serine/threonine protein phosphatase 1
VGDLTVKGPKNREVVDLFSFDPRFSSVMGNHDLALVEYSQNQSRKLKSHQQQAFEELTSDGTSRLDYLASLPFFIEFESHIVVHAGLRPFVALTEQSPADLTELRTLGPDRTAREGTPWYEKYEGPRQAVFGHWPSAEPRIGPFALGLDSGCVYGYELTAYCLESAELIRVKAKREYVNPNKNRPTA